MRLVGHGGEEEANFSVTEGHTTEVSHDGNVFKLEVLTAIPVVRLVRDIDGSFIHDATVEHPPFEDATNPGVLLKITNSSGDVEERWVLQHKDHQPPAIFDHLNFEFVWNAWTAPGGEKWWLFQLPNGDCQIALSGDIQSLRPLEHGGDFALSDGSKVRLADAEISAVLDKEIRPLEGVDFFNPAAGAVTIRATTPEGVEVFNLQAENDGDWRDIRYTGADGQPRIALLHFHTDQRDMPLEWQSKLSMLEEVDGEWQPVATGAIRVNDYFYYKGYRFFQTDARPDDPTYSGIGIVYDPGIEVVLLGFYMVMFGTFIVYFINPLVTRKHRGA